MEQKDSSATQATSEAIETITPQQFIEKLRKALRRDGDFPASAKVIAELRELVSKPNTTANQITEVILREPSLGTRVLSLVNSSFYRRAKPIMTVSQAVVQIGMRPLAEMCAGLVLLQKFVPAARKGGAFANCLKQTITTSLMTSSLCTQIEVRNKQKNDETGYLAGTFFELGSLLLAYYFPKIYESAEKRSQAKNQELSKSIKELTGLSPTELTLEVIDELKLPEFYKDIIRNAEKGMSLSESSPALEIGGQPSHISEALFASHSISAIISQGGSKEELQQALSKITQTTKFDSSLMTDVMTEVTERFKDHCSSLDLHLTALPAYVRTLSTKSSEAEEGQKQETQIFTIDGDFSRFVEEIRQAVDNRESTASIITTVMETFAWSLRFDRVLLMLIGSGKRNLSGRMLLGSIPNFDARNFQKPLAERGSTQFPESTAVYEGRPIFHGQPMFEDGWPFVAVPIGFGKRVIGIIYADRTTQDSGELTGQEQAAIGVLAELLDRSISLNG